MAIEVLCECGKKLMYRDEHEAQMAKCPVCEARLPISPDAASGSAPFSAGFAGFWRRWWPFVVWVRRLSGF
jgi:hypothetical protein